MTNAGIRLGGFVGSVSWSVLSVYRFGRFSRFGRLVGFFGLRGMRQEDCHFKS